MVKKLRCTVVGNDWVKAEPYPRDKEVLISFVEGGNEGYIFLTPDDARKLRKQIKKAIEAIEGVENVEEDAEKEAATSNAPIPKFSVGDKVIITEKGTHGFEKGEEVTLVRYQPTGWQHYEASNGEENGWLGFHEFEPSQQEKSKLEPEEEPKPKEPCFSD